MMDDEIVKRMSLLLGIIFKGVKITGIAIHITKDGNIIFSDQETDYCKEIIPRDILEIYEKYLEKEQEYEIQTSDCRRSYD